MIPEGGWWLLSLAFGVLIGLAEVMLRYKNDPVDALRTPYAIFYLVLNGFSSLVGYWILRKYSQAFAPKIADDNFLLMMLAGFGSMILMRSKLFTFRGDDNREYPLGPDILFSALNRFLDDKIDRLRAVQRQRLVFRKMKDIDDFELASQYVKASLLSFQGLTELDRREIADAIDEYRAVDWPDPLRLMALGFAILAISGEENFDSLLDGLKVALSAMKEAKPQETRTLDLESFSAS
jgi:hypothetical protein